MNLFNEEYYEDGLKNHVSGYKNYSWQPTRSIPEALDIIKYFNFNTCLDYGCAKGYLVHALRILGRDAYGEDISTYAIDNCHPSVKDFVSQPTDNCYDLLICKDVLEHILEDDLSAVLNKFKSKATQFFFTIPLGDNDHFRIREYELDITHVTKKDEEWWLNLFKSHGFELLEFSYTFGSMKKKWIDSFPYGNGFFTLSYNK
tara:strand:+ start:347 stop:952 length:606 start_codon:yes stop_codon:yes gene_type:complete